MFAATIRIAQAGQMYCMFEEEEILELILCILGCILHHLFVQWQTARNVSYIFSFSLLLV